MKLYEYVYGLFDDVDYTFVEGTFPISIGEHTYDVTCHEVVQLRKKQFSLFPGLSDVYSRFEAKCKPFSNSLPMMEESLLLHRTFFEKQIKTYQKKQESLADQIYCLVKPVLCLRIQITHDVDGDPMDFITSLRDDNGIEEIRQIFLSVVREFHNYHIVMRSPHIYVTDIHCRSTDGMFSFFCTRDMAFSTNVRPIISYWEPKLKRNAHAKALEHFKNGKSIPIETLAMARARVHAERQHRTLAIIHAVMALEVVVPEFVNRVLKHNGVSSSVVNDFNHKFGLSVRVKAFLKMILPETTHGVIDDAGIAITHRNKILHEGLQDASLSSVEVDDLVHACGELIDKIKTYSKRHAF